MYLCEHIEIYFPRIFISFFELFDLLSICTFCLYFLFVFYFLFIYYRPVRLHLYSAHDSSLMALLLAFKLDSRKWPPFASNLVIELYECNATKKYYVIVRYNGQVSWIFICNLLHACKCECCCL